LKAIYQFDLSGNGGGKWAVHVKDGTCEVKEGEDPSPNITISMTAQDYLDITSGKLNGQMPS
jgi:putative sterol carrier protein